jgi:hypothetical protein
MIGIGGIIYQVMRLCHGQYKDKWNWSSLFANESLPWSMDLVEKFRDKLDERLKTGCIIRANAWPELSNNKSLPWSIEFIEKYKCRWEWINLARNESLPWSIELIERFKNDWYWGALNQKAIDCLPKLSLQDIDEVMSHHFHPQN